MQNHILSDTQVVTHHLQDNKGRIINYLRLAVTDRCNFRCQYCQPDGPVNISPKNELLSYEEMERLVQLFANLGVNKIRLTGGEPFVRKGLLEFIRRIKKIDGINELAITTNGSLIFDHIPKLEQLGVTGINFSLDTLSPQRFYKITGRDAFHEVFSSILAATATKMHVKINVVVLDENVDELCDLARLAYDFPVDVRFIETMVFNGREDIWQKTWDQDTIRQCLLESFPSAVPCLPLQPSTSQSYRIKDFLGTIGVIGGRSRSFCRQCNKVRITPQGILKTCLYDEGALDLKVMLRNGTDEKQIQNTIKHVVYVRHENGVSAESARQTGIVQSMAGIGG